MRSIDLRQLLVLVLVASCSVPAATDETVEEVTSSACNSTYKTRATSTTSAYSSYACAPSVATPGGEYIMSLTIPTAGEVVISAANYNEYPFLVVLNDHGTGVDPTSCVAANFYSVQFTATAGQKVYVVVDSTDAGSMTFDLRIGCNITTEGASKAQCSDGFDNDGNGKTDCADPTCAQYCPTTQCTPDGVLSCGDTKIEGSTSGIGTTDVLNQYACESDMVPNSSEHAYTFTATTTGWVNFTISEASQYPMLYVLDDTAGGCSPNNCIGFNYYSNLFYATAGHTYHLIVDGTGASGKAYDYLASLICNPPTTETDCNNDIDDDGNGLVDCEDPACMSTPTCQQTGCTAAGALDCNSKLVAGSTDTSAPGGSGSTDTIASYSCDSSVSLGGPEHAYQLGPFTKAQPVVVTLSNESTYGMISILQDAGSGCNPSSCVYENYGSVTFNAKANTKYYAVVEGQGAPSVSYDISVVCSPPGSEHGFCFDGIDNDGNGLIDCDDPACATDCGATCSATGTLTDTTTLLPGSTSATGSTNALTSYTCDPTLEMPGNEYIYKYTPSKSGTVLFTLSNESNYAAISVLKGPSCDTNECVAEQFYSVEAAVTQGSTYYVVVDAPQAGPVSYDISVIPNPPSTEAGLCNDGIDNDGNFLIDADDPACQ